MRKRELLKKIQPLINIRIKLYSLFPRKFTRFLFYRSLKKRGYLGILKRYCLLKVVAKSCGNNVAVFDNTVILNVENISFGDNVAVQPFCYLEGLGGIEIGNEVGLAHGVSVLSTSHNIERTDIPHTDQGISKKSVKICDDVWLGCKSTILMGIEIGKGAVIGANSVVTKDVSPYAVCVGSPAKEIRCRK